LALDIIGTTILIPVLAPLFLSPSALFTTDTPFATRTFLLGLIGASFPFAQFFGAPILGALSDKYGRKPVLLLSLAGTLFARLLFAFGIMLHSLPLIIISPIIDGFTGGNISIALSAIADISDPKQKAKNFGLIGMSFGIGFVLGPFLGGVLTNAKILPWFNYATPYFFTAALTLFNIILMSVNFKETLSQKVASHVSLLTGVRNFKKAFASPNFRVMFITASPKLRFLKPGMKAKEGLKLRTLKPLSGLSLKYRKPRTLSPWKLIVIFLVNFGFMFFIQSFQVYLIEKFHYTSSTIGYLFTLIGLVMAFTQAVILRKLLNKFTSIQILKVSMIGLGLMIMMLLSPTSGIYFFILNPILAVFQGLTQPNLTATVSDLADRSDQGEILGINQSVMSLAWAIPPLLAGISLAININLPLVFASLSVVLGWAVFIFLFKPKKHFQEA